MLVDQKRRGAFAADFPGRSHTTIWGVSGTLEQELSDALTLKSITAYREVDLFEVSNIVGQGGLRAVTLFASAAPGAPTVRDANILDGRNYQDQHQFSQELQLIGTTNRLRYVAGLYYFREAVKSENPQRQLLFGVNPNLPATIGLIRELSTNVTGVTNSYAAFVQTSYTPAIFDEKLELTIGGRFTRDERSIDQSDTLFGGLDPAPGAQRKLSQAFENFSYAASLRYMLNDDANIYGRFSTGYLSGGFNVADRLSSGFRPEKVSGAWELVLPCVCSFAPARWKYNRIGKAASILRAT